MPTLVFPPAKLPNNGDVTDADKTFGLFYDDTVTYIQSLLVVNSLDYDNLDPSFAIAAEHTQRGSWVDAEGSSGTANLDYKHTWFGNYGTPDEFTEPDDDDPVTAIPGGCRSFYLKWDAQVLIMWEIFWTAASTVNDELSSILLMVDGNYANSQYRGHSKIGDVFSIPSTAFGYRKARCWSGHNLQSLDGGRWHSVGLNILADSSVRMTRVHAVSIDIMPMKRLD